jgi:hypothetical protein
VCPAGHENDGISAGSPNRTFDSMIALMHTSGQTVCAGPTKMTRHIAFELSPSQYLETVRTDNI